MNLTGISEPIQIILNKEPSVSGTVTACSYTHQVECDNGGKLVTYHELTVIFETQGSPIDGWGFPETFTLKGRGVPPSKEWRVKSYEPTQDGYVVTCVHTVEESQDLINRKVWKSIK